MSQIYTTKTGLYPSLSPAEPENRDPHSINKHLQLDFSNVIGEPDRSAHNFPAFHDVLSKVYQFSKLFMYRFLTILVGLPLMILYGLTFGTYIFLMIWMVAPMRRLFQSLISEFGIYIQTVCDAMIAPIFRSFGFVYSNVRVSLSRESIHSTKPIQV